MLTIEQFDKGNRIPAQYQNNAGHAVGIANEIFAAFPNRFRFTSGYRTPEQNKQAGGKANSFHITGEAADFVHQVGSYSASEKSQIAAIVAKYGYEVIYHNAGSGYHYHIEPAPGGKKTPGTQNFNLPPPSPREEADSSTGLIVLAVIAVLFIFND